MITTTIQLEPHDDAVSIRDKLGWTPAERIVLVWPGRGLEVDRLELVLIKRRASQLGAQLALVGAGAQVKEHARDLRIPVFSSLKQAESKRWRTPRFVPNPAEGQAERQAELRRARLELHTAAQAWRAGQDSFPRGVSLAISALGLLAVFAILAVLGPRAEIHLVPQVHTQEASLALAAGIHIRQVSPPGQLPARPVTVVIEGRSDRPTTGQVEHPDQPAAGQAVFTNLTSTPIDLPAGLVVRGAGAVRFATRQAAQLAAGPGQAITLPVQALIPGPEGNLPAGSLQAIEDPLGARMSVTNPAPTRGGRTRAFSAPSPSDRAALESELNDSLRRTALQEMRAGLPDGDQLLEASLYVSQTLLDSFDPPGDEPADQVSLTLRLEYTALAVSAADLQSLAAAVLDDELPSGYQALPGEISFESLTAPETGAEGFTAWQARATRQVQAAVDPAQLASLVRGQTPAEAARRLMGALPLSRPPEITTWPRWWPRLPLAPFRTLIIVEPVVAP